MKWPSVIRSMFGIIMDIPSEVFCDVDIHWKHKACCVSDWYM